MVRVCLSILACFPVAVINTTTKCTLGEKGFICLQVTVCLRGQEPRAGTEAESNEGRPLCFLLTRRLVLSSLTQPPPATHGGLGSPHQSTVNAPQTCLQASLMKAVLQSGSFPGISRLVLNGQKLMISVMRVGR